MEHHDATTGRLCSRREALAMLSAAGAAALFPGLAARAQDRIACVARPEQTEGPYFIDTGLARSDIRADPGTGVVRAGLPLQLTFLVSRLDAAGCVPLRDAHVELWHCDASGVYSGVKDPAFDTSDQKFLRGYQETDAHGAARFTTIYPGWYPGRTVHLHFLIRTRRAGGQREQFTSQLYFDDALSDKVYARAPYATRKARTLRNGGDGIYRRGGAQLLLAATEKGEGLAATFHIGLKPAAQA